jgi:hypothetical protein
MSSSNVSPEHGGTFDDPNKDNTTIDSSEQTKRKSSAALSSSRPHKRSKTAAASSSSLSFHSSSDEDSSDDDAPKKRKPWTTPETIGLILAVFQHDFGHWAEAKQAFPVALNRRSNVDIKDKVNGLGVTRDNKDAKLSAILQDRYKDTLTMSDVDQALLLGAEIFGSATDDCFSMMQNAFTCLKDQSVPAMEARLSKLKSEGKKYEEPTKPTKAKKVKKAKKAAAKLNHLLLKSLFDQVLKE